MSAPRVTVLMSVYNAQAFLRSAVDSILNQSFCDFKFVIYDDGSTDGSSAILASYRDSRVELRLNGTNRGLTANLIDGITRAESEFIARMDADDISMSHRFARQVEYLDNNADVDVLGTSAVFFTPNGREISGRQPVAHDDIALTLFFDFTMLHPTVMIRRAALTGSRLNYNAEFKYSQDFDLWSRMIRFHKFANLPETLVRQREHPCKITRAHTEQQQRFTNRIRSRQLKWLLPTMELEEEAVFCAAARGETFKTVAELSQLERVLKRLISANQVRRVFPAAKFASYASAFFRYACWRMLKEHDSGGSAFWRSTLRRSDQTSVRELASMAWLTAQAQLSPKPKSEAPGRELSPDR